MKTVLFCILFLVFAVACPSPALADDAGDLIDAIFRGDISQIQTLLERGADVNIKNKWGKTALMYAATEGNTEIVKALLEAKADVNAKANNGRTALWIAAENGHTDVVKALLERGADVNMKNEWGETALMYAATEGNTDIVKAMLESKADVNAKDTNGRTALYVAATEGHTDVVKALLEKGADVNAKNTNGVTTLMIAAEMGHTEIVKVLLESKADVNIQHKTDGVTALYVAVQKGHTEIVKLLLENKADVNVKHKADGVPALWMAVRNSHAQAPSSEGSEQVQVTVVVKKAIWITGDMLNSLQPKPDSGKQLLMLKIEIENKGKTDLVLAEEGDIQMTFTGTKPSVKQKVYPAKGIFIDVALKWIGLPKSVKLQTKAGWINNVGLDPEKPYGTHHFFKVGDYKLTIQPGGKFEFPVSFHLPAKAKRLRLIVTRMSPVKVLPTSMATHKSYGVTPLIMASQNGHTEVVRLLLEAGADVNAKASKAGKDYTPLSIAKEMGHTQIIKLLKEYGAKD